MLLTFKDISLLFNTRGGKRKNGKDINIKVQVGIWIKSTTFNENENSNKRLHISNDNILLNDNIGQYIINDYISITTQFNNDKIDNSSKQYNNARVAKCIPNFGYYYCLINYI